MAKNIIIINGPATVGKDTFVRLFSEVSDEYCKHISIIDPVKEIANEYTDYDENRKYDEDRNFLSDLKCLLEDYCATPSKYVIESIEKFISNPFQRYLFIDIRLWEDIEKIMNYLSNKYENNLYINYYTLLITSTKLENVSIGNRDDDTVLNHKDKYTFVIKNDGDLKSLRKNAKDFYISLVTANDNKISHID